MPHNKAINLTGQQRRWLTRRAAVGAIKEAKITKWAAIVGAAAAAVAAVECVGAIQVKVPPNNAPQPTSELGRWAPNSWS